MLQGIEGGADLMRPVMTVFIDGEAGTTGLGIRERLRAHPDIAVKSVDLDRRKDPDARRALMAHVDLVVLCLPDAAAKEAVAMIDGLGEGGPRVLDASTAHRVAPGLGLRLRGIGAGAARRHRAARRKSRIRAATRPAPSRSCGRSSRRA